MQSGAPASCFSVPSAATGATLESTCLVANNLAQWTACSLWSTCSWAARSARCQISQLVDLHLDVKQRLLPQHWHLSIGWAPPWDHCLALLWIITFTLFPILPLRQMWQHKTSNTYTIVGMSYSHDICRDYRRNWAMTELDLKCLPIFSPGLPRLLCKTPCCCLFNSPPNDNGWRNYPHSWWGIVQLTASVWGKQVTLQVKKASIERWKVARYVMQSRLAGLCKTRCRSGLLWMCTFCYCRTHLQRGNRWRNCAHSTGRK